MPKLTTLPNTNNQLPAVQAKTIKLTTQATPQDYAAKIISKPAEHAPAEGQPSNTEDKGQEAQPIDPKFEALAKKESALRTREKDFQAREASLDAKIQEAVTKALGEYRAKVKQSPLDVLNDEGITYDQLVEAAVNAPDPSTRKLEQKLQSIEEAQRKLQENAENSAKAQRESAVNQIRHDVKDLVTSDAQYETIKGTDSIEDVVELITRTFDESGKLLSVDDAAKLVEEELFTEAVKIASLSKVKAKLTPQQEEPKLQSIKQPQHMTTLTNNMTSSKPMSARERAIRVFKGEKF